MNLSIVKWNRKYRVTTVRLIFHCVLGKLGIRGILYDNCPSQRMIRKEIIGQDSIPILEGRFIIIEAPESLQCFLFCLSLFLYYRNKGFAPVSDTDRQTGTYIQRHLGRQSSKSKQETSERDIRADKKMAYTDRQTDRQADTQRQRQGQGDRLISVVDDSFAHNTMPNLPRHILSYATVPCQILFYADSSIYMSDK